MSITITLELCQRTISCLTQGVGTSAKYSSSADLRKRRSEWYCCSYWNPKGWVLTGRELAGCGGDGLISLMCVPHKPLLRVGLCIHRVIPRVFRDLLMPDWEPTEILRSSSAGRFWSWLHQMRETLVMSQYTIVTLLKHQRGYVLGERIII